MTNPTDTDPPGKDAAPSFDNRNDGRSFFQLAFLVIFFNCLVLVLGLSIVELVLHKFFPVELGVIGHATAPNASLYGWGFAPGQTITVLDPDNGKIYESRANSHGWRDVEHAYDKPKDTYRILVLGDSNTFGAVVPAEKIYSRVLEKLLRDKGAKVEVISMAYGGWGTDQELEALVNEGTKYAPNLIVLQFCTNDLDDNDYYRVAQRLKSDRIGWKPFFYSIESGELEKLENPHFSSSGMSGSSEEPSARALIKKVIAHSEILKRFYVAYRSHSLREDRIGSDTRDTQSIAQFSISENQIRMLELNIPSIRKSSFGQFLDHQIGKSIARADLLFQISRNNLTEYSDIIMRILEKRWFHDYWREADFRMESPIGTDYKWALYRALIQQMKRVADGIDSKLVVIPETEAGHYSWQVSWYRTEDSVQNKMNQLGHLRILQDLLAEIGVPMIEPKRIYVRARNDPHANEEGNRAMAEDIVDFLLERPHELGYQSK